MAAMTDSVSPAVRKVEERMRNAEPGSLRWRTLEALKLFRASWVDLGRMLNDIAYGGDYKEWGYDDFEVYCARELGLKKPTVQKLMISYNYMRRYESKRLDGFESEEAGGADGDIPDIPDFQTVELLDKIRRRGDFPEERMDELHRRAFADGDTAEDETSLRKELRSLLTPDAAARTSTPCRELTAAITAARALRRRLSVAGEIPEGLRERLEQALTELEALA